MMMVAMPMRTSLRRTRRHTWSDTAVGLFVLGLLVVGGCVRRTS